MMRILQQAASLCAVLTFGALSVSAQTWKGTSPADAAQATTDDEKTVYLWNVGTKTFLEKGGRWGTEAVQGTTTNGVAFTVETTTSGGTTYYKLKTNMTAEGSTGNAYLTFMGASTGNVTKYDNLNYFVDQNNTTYSRFTIASVSGGYTITCNSYQMFAAKNSSSSSEVTNAINGFTSSYASSNNNVWLLVTKKERDEYFKESTGNGKEDAGASYFISDYDFARRDLGISKWFTADGTSMVNGIYSTGIYETTPSKAYSTAAASYIYTGTCTYYYTRTHNVTKTETTWHGESWSTTCSDSYYHNNSTNVTLTLQSWTGGYTYYVGNGIAEGDNQEDTGGKWTANIHGASGKLYQTVTVPVAGTYRVKCKGFTTIAGKATLYATSGDKTSSTALATSELSATDENTTYVNGYEELQKDGHSAAVTVYANEKGEITFGVEVKDGDATGWACFDDFELEYVGTGDVFVILDETKENVEYLNKQNTNDKVKTSKATVYLHRSFSAGVWNTIVLPFDLNAGAVTAAFGSGTKLSKFKGATDENHPNRLYFEKADAIEKDQLYIIMPTTAEPTVNVEVKATADESLTLKEKYYTIDGVSFARTDYTYPEGGLVGGTDTGKETYNGETNLEFKGTYVKKTGVIPSGSYLIFAGDSDVEGSTGKWKLVSTTWNSRAFRGWLQPVQTSAEASNVSIYINGVEAGGSETTGIAEAIIAPAENAIRGNIYTLSGQLVRQNATTTEGLAKGIYVSNGKKFVVK